MMSEKVPRKFRYTQKRRRRGEGKERSKGQPERVDARVHSQCSGVSSGQMCSQRDRDIKKKEWWSKEDISPNGCELDMEVPSNEVGDCVWPFARCNHRLRGTGIMHPSVSRKKLNSVGSQA